MQSRAYQQAVRTQLIATIANGYYTLLMLDKQLAITEETALLWQQSVETMKAMKTAGMTNEAAVAQSEANCYAIGSFDTFAAPANQRNGKQPFDTAFPSASDHRTRFFRRTISP